MKRILKRILKVGIYILTFLILTLGSGVLGFMSSLNNSLAFSPVPPLPTGTGFSMPAAEVPFDPSKPIVAIMLGDDLTEISDFLAPYEIFVASKAFNVYAVAPQRHVTTLTGGLEVLPDLSLDEFDRRFGRDPDMIVTPYIPNIKNAHNQPIVNWIKRHAGPNTLLLSWCTGASVLAETGLLDGKAATAHWNNIDQLEKDYPKVRWVRGLRYVDEGNNIVSSAGILSGIDASLHVLSKLKGSEFTKNLAQELRYQDYQYVDNPKTQQFKAGPADSIMLLNAAYKWEKDQYGVLLYEGVDELDVASFLDTYSASFTADTWTVAIKREIITTRHGLKLVPRLDLASTPKFDRLLVPGVDALQVAPAQAIEWARSNSVKTAFLHAYKPDRFAYEVPLEDLAQQQNVPTATFAQKRLEYRPGAGEVSLKGEGWPVLLILRPLLLGLAGPGLILVLERAFLRRRKPNESAGDKQRAELKIASNP